MKFKFSNTQYKNFQLTRSNAFSAPRHNSSALSLFFKIFFNTCDVSANVILCLPLLDKACLVQTYYPGEDFCQKVCEDFVVLIEYAYWLITSTFSFVFPLFWYQRNHCISPKRSYANLDNVLYVSFINGFSKTFIYLYHHPVLLPYWGLNVILPL